MKVLAICNQKGGVGKTTCTINLGAGLHLAGGRVLLVDFDPQGSLTKWTGCQAGTWTAYEVLTGTVGLQDAVTTTAGGYDVLPADIRLTKATEKNRPQALRKALKGARYDYVLIDCPPSLSPLTTAGLTAADAVIIPMTGESSALDAVAALLKTVAVVREELNPQLEVAGVVFTKFSRPGKTAKEVLANTKAYLPVFDTKIRVNGMLDTAQGNGQDIFTYNPKCNGAADFAALAIELVKKGY